MGASDPSRLGEARPREGHHRRASVSRSDQGRRRGAIAREADATPSRELLLPAPADPLVHTLAGLRARIRLRSTRRSGPVVGVLAAVTTFAVASVDQPSP